MKMFRTVVVLAFVADAHVKQLSVDGSDNLANSTGTLVDRLVDELFDIAFWAWHCAHLKLPRVQITPTDGFFCGHSIYYAPDRREQVPCSTKQGSDSQVFDMRVRTALLFSGLQDKEIKFQTAGLCDINTLLDAAKQDETWAKLIKTIDIVDADGERLRSALTVMTGDGALVVNNAGKSTSPHYKDAYHRAEFLMRRSGNAAGNVDWRVRTALRLSGLQARETKFQEAGVCTLGELVKAAQTKAAWAGMIRKTGITDAEGRHLRLSVLNMGKRYSPRALDKISGGGSSMTEMDSGRDAMEITADENLVKVDLTKASEVASSVSSFSDAMPLGVQVADENKFVKPDGNFKDNIKTSQLEGMSVEDRKQVESFSSEDVGQDVVDTSPLRNGTRLKVGINFNQGNIDPSRPHVISDDESDIPQPGVVMGDNALPQEDVDLASGGPSLRDNGRSDLEIMSNQTGAVDGPIKSALVYSGLQAKEATFFKAGVRTFGDLLDATETEEAWATMMQRLGLTDSEGDQLLWSLDLVGRGAQGVNDFGDKKFLAGDFEDDNIDEATRWLGIESSLRHEPRETPMSEIRFDEINDGELAIFSKKNIAQKIESLKDPQMVEQRVARVAAAEKEPLPEFVIVGRTNCGKSSMINHVLNIKNLVLASRKPGKTTKVDLLNVNGRFILADTPGYGVINNEVSDKWGEVWLPLVEAYMKSTPWIAAGLFLMDIGKEVDPVDKQILSLFEKHSIPVVLILTKDDKIKHRNHRMERISRIRKGLQWPEQYPHLRYVAWKNRRNQGIRKNQVLSMILLRKTLAKLVELRTRKSVGEYLAGMEST